MIRHSNESGFLTSAKKRKLAIFKDLDMLVENILTHRRKYTKRDKDRFDNSGNDRERDRSLN